MHSPHTAPPGWPEKGDAGAYRGSLWSTDQYVGQIVSVLKARGLWNNTLLVLTADNGGPIYGDGSAGANTNEARLGTGSLLASSGVMRTARVMPCRKRLRVTTVVR